MARNSLEIHGVDLLVAPLSPRAFTRGAIDQEKSIDTFGMIECKLRNYIGTGSDTKANEVLEVVEFQHRQNHLSQLVHRREHVAAKRIVH